MKRRHALGAPPGRFATPEQKWAVLERDGWICTYCHRPLEFADAVLDHLVPWKAGGPTETANLAACCRRCNKRKGNRSEAEFREMLEGHLEKEEACLVD